MIILDERNVLKAQFETQGLDVFDFFEAHQVLDVRSFVSLPLQRRSEVLLVDTQTLLKHSESLEKCRTLFNTFVGVIFFHDGAESSKFLNQEASFLNKVIGEYAIPLSPLEWTILGNQLQFFWTMKEEQTQLQKHMARFSTELESLMKATELEVVKAKKIHDVLIPRRHEEIKGVSFSSKYATGDGGGGEFCDFHHTGNKVYQVLLSSQSYLVSSALLGVLNKHKQKTFDPMSFIADAQEEVLHINHSKNKKTNAEILLVEMDITNMSVKLYGHSKAEFCSQMSGMITPQDNGFVLSRGEKVVVFSPGFLFNWRERKENKDIHQFVKDHRHLGSGDLLTELFYQLRKDRETMTKDATVLMMEVKRHGMHQI